MRALQGPKGEGVRKSRWLKEDWWCGKITSLQQWQGSLGLIASLVLIQGFLLNWFKIPFLGVQELKLREASVW